MIDLFEKDNIEYVLNIKNDDMDDNHGLPKYSSGVQIPVNSGPGGGAIGDHYANNMIIKKGQKYGESLTPNPDTLGYQNKEAHTERGVSHFQKNRAHLYADQ